jgi:acetyl-CoA carboxylase biotin carboxyl carrier protein
MELRKIRSLMAMVSESAIHDLELTTAEGSVRIVRGAAAGAAPQAAVPMAPMAPIGAAQATPAADIAAAPATPSSGSEPIVLRSPMVGFGLRARDARAEPLVRVGDTVQAGQPVCVIRAMKLHTDIKAQAAGVLTQVLWEDGEPVQYGQPLLEFRSTAAAVASSIAAPLAA